MNLSLSDSAIAALEAEASKRNTVDSKGKTTAETLATELVESAATSYAVSATRAKAEALWAKLQAAPSEVQQAVLAAAENALL
jgi:hypothetical protein